MLRQIFAGLPCDNENLFSLCHIKFRIFELCLKSKTQPNTQQLSTQNIVILNTLFGNQPKKHGEKNPKDGLSGHMKTKPPKEPRKKSSDRQGATCDLTLNIQSSSCRSMVQFRTVIMFTARVFLGTFQERFFCAALVSNDGVKPISFKAKFISLEENHFE